MELTLMFRAALPQASEERHPSCPAQHEVQQIRNLFNVQSFRSDQTSLAERAAIPDLSDM